MQTPDAHAAASPRLPSLLDVADAFPPVSEAEWRARVDRDLDGKPFERRLMTQLYEGFSLKPLYTELNQEVDGGRTGMPPMTRGARALGTAVTGWDIRTERREPLPDMLAARVMDDLGHGATSVLIRYGAACRAGMDPDDPRAAGLVGRDGACLSTVADLDRVFDGVHLGMITVALEAGAAFLPAAAQVMALWRSRGVADDEARADFCADPLAVLAREGVLPMGVDEAMRGMAALAAHTAQKYPRSRAVRVGVAPYHHAGATATQDLAFAMATGVEYLRAMTALGMPIQAATGQMLFSFAVGCNQFLAMAKLRAARRMWSRVVESCGGRTDARRMSMHVRTSKRVLTHRDPWVNLLRNTACCFAAGAAGADVITSAPFDDALGLPTALSRRIARNTQVILQEESHVHRVADPAGGSWFIESLTDQLAGRAWEIFQEIERLGGMSAVLRSGWVLEQIESAFEPREKNVATRRDAVLGVSEFPVADERAVERVEVDHRAVLGQCRARLLSHASQNALKSDALSLIPALETIDGDGVAAVADAAGDGATMGQLSLLLGMDRGDGGDGVERLESPIAPHPYAEPFEALRDRADAFSGATGTRPAVHLVNIGGLTEHQARAGFSRNLFEAGGFEVLSGPGVESVDEAAAAFAAAGASIAVICSTDARYESVIDELAPALHRAGARTVVLAGHPADNEAAYREAGVDLFIYMRCDALAILTELMDEETLS